MNSALHFAGHFPFICRRFYLCLRPSILAILGKGGITALFGRKNMTLIDTLAATGPIMGLAACTFLLFHFTALPVWAVLLISIPVGGVAGIAGGIGLGMAIEFLILKQTRKE